MDEIHIEGKITINDLEEWTKLLLQSSEPLVVYITKSYGVKNDEKEHISNMVLSKYSLFIQALIDTSRLIITISSKYILAGSMAWILSADIHYTIEGTKFGFPEVKVNELPLFVSILVNTNSHCVRKIKYFLITGKYFDTTKAIELGLLDKVYCNMEEIKNEIEYLYTLFKYKSKDLKCLPIKTVNQGNKIYGLIEQ